MLREALDSDLVSVYLNTSSNGGKRNKIRMFCVCGYDQSQLSPKTFSWFLNPFDCTVNIPFKTVPYQVMFCPIREKWKGFVSCSTLRARSYIHAQRSSSCPFSTRRVKLFSLF